MRYTKPILAALMLTTLTLCAGCGGKEPPRPVPLLPPEVLLNDCEPPAQPEALAKPRSIREYATAVTRWAIDLEERLNACNGDKKALREWCEAVRQGAIQHD